jgi:hypothetical protein
MASRVGRALSDLKKYQIRHCADPETDTLIKSREIEDSFNNLPDSTRLWELLDPEGVEINAKFAELVKCMYERGLGWQSHHFRVQNLAIERLKKKLSNVDTGSQDFEVECGK